MSYRSGDAKVGSLSGSPIALNGQVGYNLKIDVPAGNGGIQPDLNISYSSGSGHIGMFGVGFNFSASSTITRIPRSKYHDGEYLPPQEISDDRYALDGMRLFWDK